MSKYVNPVTEVETQEEAEITYPISLLNLKCDNYGKFIVGVYDNGLYKVAMVLEDEINDFDYIEKQYSLGLFLSRKFYAVSLDFINKFSQ